MLGGVLVFMTLSVQETGPMKDTAWVLIGLEVLLYLMLLFSEPGIPAIILRKAAEIERSGSTNDRTTYLLNSNNAEEPTPGDQETQALLPTIPVGGVD